MKKSLIVILIVALILCIGNLYIQNRELKKEITSLRYYRTNLSGDEMKANLMQVVNDSISLFIPGDTSVSPYLIKSENRRITDHCIMINEAMKKGWAYIDIKL